MKKLFINVGYLLLFIILVIPVGIMLLCSKKMRKQFKENMKRGKKE